MSEQLTLFQEVVRCRICNRKLKSEKARKNGYGCHCYKLYLSGFRGFQSTIDDFIKDNK